jgi:hypothetical protein
MSETDYPDLNVPSALVGNTDPDHRMGQQIRIHETNQPDPSYQKTNNQLQPS